MPASGFFTSCAITAAISPSLASAVCSRSCASSATRAVRSCRMPVNFRSPCVTVSPTDRCSGNVVPSLRRPVTSRPMPMIFGVAGVEIARQIAVVLLVIRRRHQHVDVLPDHFVFARSRTAAPRRD